MGNFKNNQIERETIEMQCWEVIETDIALRERLRKHFEKFKNTQKYTDEKFDVLMGFIEHLDKGWRVTDSRLNWLCNIAVKTGVFAEFKLWRDECIDKGWFRFVVKRGTPYTVILNGKRKGKALKRDIELCLEQSVTGETVEANIYGHTVTFYKKHLIYI